MGGCLGRSPKTLTDNATVSSRTTTSSSTWTIPFSNTSSTLKSPMTLTVEHGLSLRSQSVHSEKRVTPSNSTLEHPVLRKSITNWDTPTQSEIEYYHIAPSTIRSDRTPATPSFTSVLEMQEDIMDLQLPALSKAKTVSPRVTGKRRQADSFSYSVAATKRFATLQGKKATFFATEPNDKALALARNLSKTTGRTNQLGDFLLTLDDVKIQKDITLGGGIFSKVYAGRYRKAQVAVKSVFDARKYIEEGSIFFECSRHPCICTCFGLLPLEDENFIVMERFESSVLEAMNRGKKFQFKDLVSMAKQICSGVNHLHSSDVGHGDCSLRNVLLDSVSAAPRCVISDFGLSTKLPARTATNAIPVRWSSPELFQSKLITKASDVWAIGCTIFELFTFGQRPFPESSTSEAAVSLSLPSEPPWPCGNNLITREEILSLLHFIFTTEDERISLPALIALLDRMQKKLTFHE